MHPAPSVILFSVLSGLGFVPGGTLAQPESALAGITLAFAGVSVLPNSIAIVLMAISPGPDELTAGAQPAPALAE